MTSTIPATSSATRSLDLLLELLLVALLIIQPALYGPVDAWSEMIGLAIGGAMAILLALRRLTIRHHHPRRWLVSAPVVLFVLIVLIQLVPWPAEIVKSITPHTFETKRQLLDDLPNARTALSYMTIGFYAQATLHDLRVVLQAIVVLATVLTIYQDPQRMRRILLVITLIGAAVACLAIAQDLSGTDKIYWRVPVGQPARSGTFVNHSSFGQFMNLSIGAALALLMMLLLPAAEKSVGRIQRWLAACGVGAIVALGWTTIALSLTRGGIISAIIAGLLSLLVLLTHRRLRVLGVALILVVAIAAGMLWHFGADRVVDRMQLPDAAGSRAQMNLDSWHMSSQFPLLGTGLGTFQWVFPGYDHTLSRSTATYADNDYLQALAETGWIGLLLILSFVAIICWHWLRALRSDSRTTAVAAIGLGYGLLAVMLHSLSDFGQHLPANTCLSAITCGLLINLGGKSPQVARRGRIGAIVVLLLIAGASAWILFDADCARRAEAGWIIARRFSRRFADRGWTGDATEIAELNARADDAVANQSSNAYYRYWQAVYDWRLATHRFEPDSPELKRRTQQVVDQLNAARAICPTYGAVYTFLGQIEYQHLGLPIGITHIQTGARLDPNDPTAWFAAGRTDAQRGRFDAANAKFLRALHLDYTQIDDIADLYIDALDEPQQLVDLVEGSPYRMKQVANALLRRPRYTNAGNAEYRHAIELSIDAERLNPTAQNLGQAGLESLELQKPADAEQFFAAAIRLDAAQTRWHIGRAQALMTLKRWSDADQEIEWLRLHQPDAPELADLVRRLDDARRAK